MTYEDFRTKYDGKFVDYDGYYGNQCMDLYRQYCKECLEVPQSPAVSGAKDVWDTYLSDYFIRIANSPTAVPEKGDIVIWGIAIGNYGHIGIFDNGNVNTFSSFDQNWPINSPCHLQQHNYNGVLGWLRKKTPVVTYTQADMDAKNNEIATLNASLTQCNAKCDALAQEISSYPLPDTTSKVTLQKIHDIVWGKGWPWTKINQVKALLP